MSILNYNIVISMFSGNNLPKLSSFRRKRPKVVENRTNGDQYFYVRDFNQTTEKECLEYDKLNEKIYHKNLTLYNATIKLLQNSPLKITEAPLAPSRPNNYENLMLFKKRNVKKNVRDQSISIVYLILKGKKINFPELKQEGDFEPYEAIDTAESLSEKEDENMVNFIVNTQSNNKICKIPNSMKKSIVLHSLTENKVKSASLDDLYHYSSIEDNDDDNYSLQSSGKMTKSPFSNRIIKNIKCKSRGHIIRSNRTNRANLPNRVRAHSLCIMDEKHQKQPKNSALTCECPEHHNINDKILFYEDPINKKNIIDNKLQEVNTKSINILNQDTSTLNQNVKSQHFSQFQPQPQPQFQPQPQPQQQPQYQ